MNVEEDRTIWFDNADIRDPLLRCWPEDFVEFLWGEIGWGICRNAETLAETVWVISNSVRGTLFVPRLREYLSECKAAKSRAKHLRLEDIVPPIAPRDLFAHREAEEQKWDLFERFATVLFECTNEELSVQQVREKLQPFLELSPGSFECESVAGEIGAVLDWTLADVEIGTPLGAGVLNSIPDTTFEMKMAVQVWLDLPRRLGGPTEPQHNFVSYLVEQNGRARPADISSGCGFDYADPRDGCRKIVARIQKRIAKSEPWDITAEDRGDVVIFRRPENVPNSSG